MNMRSDRKDKGFTLIELMLVVAMIGLLAAVILIGQRSAAGARRDVKRAADVKSLQQALSIYLSKAQSYVVYTGCVDGADPVTAGLRAQQVIAANAFIRDPLFPSDPTQCFFYTATTGSSYSLRYTLEQNSSAGEAGNHTVVP